MFMFHSYNYSDFSLERMSVGCSTRSSKLHPFPLPWCLCSPPGPQTWCVGWLCEIKGTGKNTRMRESIFVKKREKRRQEEAFGKRHRMIFLTVNLQEVSGCCFNTFLTRESHLKVKPQRWQIVLTQSRKTWWKGCGEEIDYYVKKSPNFFSVCI